mgnify:CR=1 FL=1
MCQTLTTNEFNNLLSYPFMRQLKIEIRTTATDFVLLNLLVLNLQSAQISLFIEIEIILELFSN